MKTNKITIKKNALLLMSLLCFLPLFALKSATGNITGKITDEFNNPIQYAAITLKSAEKEVIIKGEISNDKGEFVIPNIPFGTYKLVISMMGFTSYETQITVDEKSNSRYDITLHEATEQLNQVTVTAKKQFIELEEDKMVINPEASISMATENVFEILKKLPGVSIDANDNISLKGVQGVKIMIDGKLTYVSGSQLSSLLKSMLGKNIEKIEIIDNPPAKYDAEGTAGIIDIKTKHDRTNGLNGSLYANVGIAKKFNENAGVSLNFKQGKFNWYSNFGVWESRGFHKLDALRKFTSPELVGSSQNIDMYSNTFTDGYNFKMGVDYQLQKNQVLSLMMRKNDGAYNNDMINHTLFKNQLQQQESRIFTPSLMTSKWDNLVYNINYKWDIDSLGRSLQVDMDWAKMKFNAEIDQNSTYYDASDNVTETNKRTFTDQGNAIDIYAAKLDYVHPVSKKFSLETGLKASYVTNNGDLDMVGQITQADRFKYKEHIQAAYLIGKLKYDKTTYQLGLRLENTESEGISNSMNQIDKNSYLELFPSVFVSHKINDNNNLNLKYSYRIGRPNYNAVNPFKQMLDPYTIMEGNPFLKPEFTHAAGVSHTFKNKYVTNINFNYTTDLFTGYVYQNDETKVLTQTTENLNSAIDVSITESFSLKPFQWWKINTTVTGMYKKIDSKINTATTFEKWSFTGNMNHSFTFPKEITLELSGFYNSSQLFGNFNIKPNYQIDLAIQKKKLEDKGSIKLAAKDVFDIFRNIATSKYDNIDIWAKNKFDSQRVTLTFTYRFGADKNTTNRSNRTTSSSEEQGRSGN